MYISNFQSYNTIPVMNLLNLYIIFTFDLCIKKYCIIAIIFVKYRTKKHLANMDYLREGWKCGTNNGVCAPDQTADTLVPRVDVRDSTWGTPHQVALSCPMSLVIWYIHKIWNKCIFIEWTIQVSLFLLSV